MRDGHSIDKCMGVTPKQNDWDEHFAQMLRHSLGHPHQVPGLEDGHHFLSQLPANAFPVRQIMDHKFRPLLHIQ